jgi:hypothetical protein
VTVTFKNNIEDGDASRMLVISSIGGVQTIENETTISGFGDQATAPQSYASFSSSFTLAAGDGIYFANAASPLAVDARWHQVGVEAVIQASSGGPLLPGQLQHRATLQLSGDAGLGANTMYNARFFDGAIHVCQLNAFGLGRYPSGSPLPAMAVPIDHEPRMLAPFRGAYSTTYLLNSSGTGTTGFSRFDFNGGNRLDADAPDSMKVEGFDWVDEDTIIYAVYTSGSRNRLYLADVAAEPFAVNRNTAWNAEGYITTSVSTRIRNVRVGDVYAGYAYYGDAGQANNPNFYAIDLATGAETLLGNAGTLTGITTSFGLWTVVERGGYLYVHTTDNGVQVYHLTDATTLGALVTTYDAAALKAVTGWGGQFWGSDLTSDGRRMVLSGGEGFVFELGQPILSIGKSEADAVLSWPTSVFPPNVQPTVLNSLQSSPSLTPPSFAYEAAPVVISGKFNTVSVPLTNAASFYRLRRTH